MTFMSLPVTCGEGNEYRTRDVATPAERGGRECRGKKYSIGGKVRLWRFFKFSKQLSLSYIPYLYPP